jgi:hypothetical protein
MKIWKYKADLPKHGVVTVVEFTDKEASKATNRGPISHGFVGLYKGDTYVGWCGVNYAFQRRILPAREKLLFYLEQNRLGFTQRTVKKLAQAIYDEGFTTGRTKHPPLTPKQERDKKSLWNKLLPEHEIAI